MVGFKFLVHNGKDFPEVIVSEEMVGHKLGEFSHTRKFIKHGGKMQKELEIAKRRLKSQRQNLLNPLILRKIIRQAHYT